ncbi:hypothetical protein QDZ74_004061 [Pluralibacter gergoviae]|uniref:hypothetical protein n=1 Tax=Pluralibacter gergoviae TaxID=61647 RepID=UPI0008DC11D9|nr:hypothetical protein [Pluralibacter gergoviae]EKT9643010.1 hypothetical protein [Pluralibacter gergoviae]EKV3546156.1 hypothetical protein [Pluralibacter gergoviae]EKV9901086.1 hypothetical protein [Pluralibacter gergoviae]EKV9931677.1 hypothetical protein [Pluralibacter gergoviae]EKW6620384.1 hypothetical protein [Pluralibacter gergoviae]
MLRGKIKAVYAILFIVSLYWVCIYFGLLIFNDYFSFKSRIVFSWLSVSFIAFPFVMIFPLFYFFLVLFKGECYAFNKMDEYISYFKWVCLFVILAGVVFCFSYLFVLHDKGYVKCNGVPSGWMPGVAKEYALNPMQCKKAALPLGD